MEPMQHPVQWLLEVLSLGRGHEFNYSSTCSAKVMNEWSCTSGHLVTLYAMDCIILMLSLPQTIKQDALHNVPAQ